MRIQAALYHLPNALSLLRLFLVPFVVGLILSGQWTPALWLFVAAGVTDGLDGLVARLCHARTLLGSWLDPLADKALLVSIYLTLGVLGDVPLWLVVLVTLRDFTILLYAITDIAAGMVPGRPLLISKINTLAQIVLAALILAHKGPGWGNGMLIEACLYGVTFTTVASGAAYLISTSTAGRTR